MDVASASRNGVESISNTFTIGFTLKNHGIDEICSGALISPTFIATAGHCVLNTAGERNTDFLFSQPGGALDAPIDISKTPKVLKIFYPIGFTGAEGSEANDIAFIQLDRPIASKGWIKVASDDQLNSLAAFQEVSAYGYGKVYETNETYSKYPREYLLNWKAADASGFMTELSSKTSTACNGDSGGPVTAHLADGSEILVGTMHSAAKVVDGCGSQTPDGNFYMQVTLTNKYLTLIKAELDKSLISPSPTPTPTQSKKVTLYKITCLKGKTKKYLTGTNPKCPSGYKQTAKIRIS